MGFVLLVLKLCPIQVVISLPLWIKLTMCQLLFFFLWNFSSFFSWRRRCPRNQLFSTVCYWLISIFWLFSKFWIITHEEHLRYTFWSVAIFWAVSEALAPCSEQQKVTKTILKSFSLTNPPKSHHSSLFWCILCTATPDISSSIKNINSTVRVSRLSFRFLWLWFIQYCCWNVADNQFFSWYQNVFLFNQNKFVFNEIYFCFITFFIISKEVFIQLK